MTTKKCSVAGCGRSGKLTRGMCQRHYKRWLKHGDALATRRPELEMTPLQRVLAMADTTNPAACWTATRGIDRGGYARIAYEGKYVRAHRLSYELHVGAIPDGLEIDHTCENEACLNPAHLEPVTPEENMRRRAERQTRCRNGHLRTLENVHVDADGKRSCRPCNRDAVRRYKQRKEGAS